MDKLSLCSYSFCSSCKATAEQIHLHQQGNKEACKFVNWISPPDDHGWLWKIQRLTTLSPLHFTAPHPHTHNTDIITLKNKKIWQSSWQFPHLLSNSWNTCYSSETGLVSWKMWVWQISILITPGSNFKFFFVYFTFKFTGFSKQKSNDVS